MHYTIFFFFHFAEQLGIQVLNFMPIEAHIVDPDQAAHTGAI